MNTEAMHTPTPWTYREDGDANHFAILTGDEKQWVISFLHNGEAMPVQQKANAAFIVRAVNSHAALVDALERALPYFVSGACPEIQAIMTAALALAREG